MTGIFPLIFLLACHTAPVTGDRSLVLVSESQMARLGDQAYQEMLKEQRRTPHSGWNSLLARVGRRVLQAAAVENPEEWTFDVIQSDEINAFALPGGHVAVTAGMMKAFANSAQLAAVVGHEVAHLTARHPAQRVTLALGKELSFLALMALLKGDGSPQRRLLLAALGIGAVVGVELPFSREQERDADYIGLIYMARAGYQPSEATAFWEQMAHSASPGPPEFLSTHPGAGSRIEALREHLPEARQAYQKAASRHGKGEPIPAAVAE